MGAIPSVSLPAGLTCRKDLPCITKCYARKLERLRKTVRNSYQNNYEILKMNPDLYWREVEANIMMSRFFRFHVSGDIPDKKYLDRMIEVSKRNKHCQILCFTKQYGIVNSYIKNGGRIPKNLHLIYSAWEGLEMDNPYKMPEAHVKYRDGSTTASPNAVPCGGNCAECARTEAGCWELKKGGQVVFNEH